jgi:4-oxalomesaconate tautomerase
VNAYLGRSNQVVRFRSDHAEDAGIAWKRGDASRFSDGGARRVKLSVMPQRPIPCLFYRGGTSRGPFFHASDLPADLATRDRVLLAIMGSPDKRQIDGLGGAHPLTSKVGTVTKSERDGVDLDFLFAQLQPDSATVDTTPNCGNMLAAVVPFAIETGIIAAADPTTTVRVFTVNTSMACDITVQTPNGQMEYEGVARIDGVPGTSAPISIDFLDTAGSVCASMLPTGNVVDTIDGIEVTCIDNGMPMVLLDAAAVGRTGHETVDQLNADVELKARLEKLRLTAGRSMGLGDVTTKNYPKMCLLTQPVTGGTIGTRCFIPHVCHDAIGVLAAVTVATACVLVGSVAYDLASVNDGSTKHVAVEHPTGEFAVELELSPTDPQQVSRAALIRTARLLMRGEVFVPAATFEGLSK